MHEAGNELIRVRVLVVLDPLEERVGAVAHADDRDADLVFPTALPVLTSVSLRHCFLSWSGVAEPLGERRDHDFVRAAAALARCGVELPLELGRDTQEDGAGVSQPTARMLTPTGREVHAEL